MDFSFRDVWICSASLFIRRQEAELLMSSRRIISIKGNLVEETKETLDEKMANR
jgi:hypothetical protein